MTWQTVSVSSDASEQLGAKLGKRLKGGEVIELISDLGGGKTTFVRGLARGMSSSDHVSSPTFTISKVYKSQDLELHHFDFYRLSDPGHIAHELAEVIGRPKAVVVIEWPNIVSEVLPRGGLVITITNLDDNQRRIEFNYPDSLTYLMKDLW